ncbi:hypothetical protein NEPAR06_0703 [Nematocida parisii]|uniref:Uncharacterized protein n=1 Tax=Nematocida parisii (strain ERTm3) TaxID=935791 RepID=I3EHU8_NEMP3|nr:uncharacterized protein NEPG_02394 [Nematocida parisii ERTm1]EIJ88795.1 hypothetical protein NEQG_00614 [Nematocida parisii ERTm3]KAI5143026.1 hypothetical protein NEPAR07_0442 [Nematocida parisii]EIJ92703.1 hypothetical protein NEPG_02394 [Nematocida parisii ERTm1]KAI5153745.1 hypothetical protein NEPAR06_0703 [Nematocida parisii]KAI5156142.1 hypothetical protein NEPAR05_0319 [Nematocida parisii]|eukprot:XP_013060221.1 hypothetical protein NEPG_02394 [Nematocida parisii ERTm1]
MKHVFTNTITNIWKYNSNMKDKLNRVKIFSCALFVLTQAAANLEHIMIEPAIYEKDMYISADEFKLEKYRQDERPKVDNTGAIAPEVNYPIDIDTMVFNMENMSKVYVNRQKEKKEQQVFIFKNTDNKYMTGIKDQFITMAGKLEKTPDAQLWHLIFLKNDNHYMFMSMSHQNMCLTIVPMQATTNPNMPPSTLLGSNLKLTKCNSEAIEQRYIIKKIHPAKDEVAELDELNESSVAGDANGQNSTSQIRANRNLAMITEMLRAMSQSLIHIQEKLFGYPPSEIRPLIGDGPNQAVPDATNPVYSQNPPPYTLTNTNAPPPPYSTQPAPYYPAGLNGSPPRYSSQISSYNPGGRNSTPPPLYTSSPLYNPPSGMGSNSFNYNPSALSGSPLNQQSSLVPSKPVSIYPDNPGPNNPTLQRTPKYSSNLRI